MTGKSLMEYLFPKKELYSNLNSEDVILIKIMIMLKKVWKEFGIKTYNLSQNI